MTASRAREAGTLYVLFRVGDVEYVVPGSDVLQMEPFEGATPVPGTAGHVAGLVQVRGRVIPVIDLRVRFGLAPAPSSLDTRLVVVQRSERTVGLLVDSAREVLHLESDDVQTPPDLLAAQSRGYVRSVARAGTRLLLVIDTDKIIAEDMP